MASSALLSPAAAKPVSLRCTPPPSPEQNRTLCKSTDSNGYAFEVRLSPLCRDCLHTCHSSSRRRPNCASRTCCYCRPKSSSTLIAPIASRVRCYCFSQKAWRPLSLCGILRDEDKSRVRAISTSVASSARRKESAASSPTIVQPSLTWGIIPHSRESSQKVIDFLESEGINTSELCDVELPTSIEVMQERLDFLKKLGLSLDLINSYPLMVTCSIKKNMVPVLDYLEKLGLKSRDLPALVEKYPMILHASVVIDLMPVVDYLLGLDIKIHDIPLVLRRYPDVLGFRLEGTMSTSVAYLVGLGVRMRAIGRMLTEYPEILGMRVANTIKPKVDFLISYGIPKGVVAKILEVRPYLLGFDFEEAMQPAVECLLEAGIRKESISAIIAQYPDILGQKINDQLDQKTRWLVQELKVEPSNVPIIIEKLPQILFIKEGLAMKRVYFFMGAGCSADDVAKMVTGCPQILALSISLSLEPSLNFLLNEMKRSVEEVVKFPSYFTYDLKARIMPRYKLIAEAGIDCSLEWLLNCTEQKFKARLSADYMDDSRQGPMFQVGGNAFMESVITEKASSGSQLQTGKKKKPWEFYAHAQQGTPLRMEIDYDESDTESEFQMLSHAQRNDDNVNDDEDLDMSESPSEFDEEEEEEDDDDDDDDDDDEIERSLRMGMKDGEMNLRKSFGADVFSEEDYSEDVLQGGSEEEELDMLVTTSQFAVDDSEEKEDDWVELAKEQKNINRYR